MNAEFERRTSEIPGRFEVLMQQPLALLSKTNFPKSPAIYVFYFENIPVHVGRTKNLQQRLRGHVANSHYSASFAFKRARAETGIKATYRKGEGRADLLADPLFADAFAKALSEVADMQIRYLEVPNPIDQYLLELYAALELKTSLSEFETH
jgi:hypothetical protein